MGRGCLVTYKWKILRVRQTSKEGHRVLCVDSPWKLGADVVRDFSWNGKRYLQEVVLRTKIVSWVIIIKLGRRYDCERRKRGGFFDAHCPSYNLVMEWPCMFVKVSLVKNFSGLICIIWGWAMWDEVRNVHYVGWTWWGFTSLKKPGYLNGYWRRLTRSGCLCLSLLSIGCVKQ